MDVKNINQKNDGDCGYVCFSHVAGREPVGIYAKNMADAKDKAVAYFKAPKSKRHLVSVLVAEREDGSVVLQSTCF